MCVTCSLIPESGIKTHKCNRTKETYRISTPVTCTSDNVVYRITCKKDQCKNFVYIGQTSRRFCDRFGEHKGYVSEKYLNQVCGEHFNKIGHSKADMLPVILEQVTPKNNEIVRILREKLWIKRYEAPNTS